MCAIVPTPKSALPWCAETPSVFCRSLECSTSEDLTQSSKSYLSINTLQKQRKILLISECTAVTENFPQRFAVQKQELICLREALACTGLPGLVAQDADAGFIYLVFKGNLRPSALCTSLGKSYPESCPTVSIPDAFPSLWYLHIQGTLPCISVLLNISCFEACVVSCKCSSTVAFGWMWFEVW